MSIRKLFFISLCTLCGACSSDLFLEHNGNMPDQEKIAKVNLGLTKEEVHEILGAPSLVTGLSDDHWIYASSTVKQIAFLKPTELERNILAISFDNNKVSDIETKTLADSNNIAIDDNETQPAERQQGFFRKYFGGVGTYLPFGGKSSGKEP